MSLYMFIASEEKLEEMKNPNIIFDKTNFTLNIENEEDLGNIVINEEIRLEDAINYTSKKNISEINWIYTEERAAQILEYIKSHLKKSNEVELWRTWMDEVSKPVIHEVPLEKISTDILREVFGKKHYKHPECIIVKA